jgi:hypothetical protein
VVFRDVVAVVFHGGGCIWVCGSVNHDAF